MIVGVAQIVLNVADLDQASAPYLADGWRETFRVQSIPNHAAKASLQATPRRALNMVHLTPPEGGAVELTCYEGAPPIGGTVYEVDDHVRVHAAELERSHTFWLALGFSERADGLLEARAMLPGWRLAVELVRSDRVGPATSVDADGCVLVTVLTTAIEPELERLRGMGLLLRFTPSWTEQIGTRTATVAIVEGPSGELVELLQAPRRAERDE
jgi:catechol 2,3-dioxygenase-like lactoylglutathione lyase family enzyme